MKNINIHTKLVGLLGYPLAHSKSPAMQNRAFQSMGLNFLYLPVEVEQEGLPDVINGMKKMNFAGFNVTIPHKIRVLEFMDELDYLAGVIGAVNTAVIEKGRIKGYNTDGQGFIRSMEEGAGLTVRGKRVFVLGSGGAARAITMTLAAHGVDRIYICNRRREKAEALSSEINAKIKDCSAAVAFEPKTMEGMLKNIDILINTTSVGMHPHRHQTPMDAGLVDSSTVVCDIVYNPAQTRFLEEAAQRGCKTVNGLGMLVNQGAEAFRLWTGQRPPIEEMYKALSSPHGE